jgi:hypothetical protein
MCESVLTEILSLRRLEAICAKGQGSSPSGSGLVVVAPIRSAWPLFFFLKLFYRGWCYQCGIKPASLKGRMDRESSQA